MDGGFGAGLLPDIPSAMKMARLKRESAVLPPGLKLENGSPTLANSRHTAVASRRPFDHEQDMSMATLKWKAKQSTPSLYKFKVNKTATPDAATAETSKPLVRDVKAKRGATFKPRVNKEKRKKLNNQDEPDAVSFVGSQGKKSKMRTCVGSDVKETPGRYRIPTTAKYLNEGKVEKMNLIKTECVGDRVPLLESDDDDERFLMDFACHDFKHSQRLSRQKQPFQFNQSQQGHRYSAAASDAPLRITNMGNFFRYDDMVEGLQQQNIHKRNMKQRDVSRNKLKEGGKASTTIERKKRGGGLPKKFVVQLPIGQDATEAQGSVTPRHIGKLQVRQSGKVELTLETGVRLKLTEHKSTFRHNMQFCKFTPSKKDGNGGMPAFHFGPKMEHIFVADPDPRQLLKEQERMDKIAKRDMEQDISS